MKKRTAESLLIKISAVLFAALLVFNSTLYADALTKQTVGNPDATPPEIKAESAVLYSADLDRVVYSKNPDEIHEPYSITKLMTAYLTVKNCDLNKLVTVSEAAAEYRPDGTTIWLKPGEQISVRELLYGALLESGNDAACALAEATAGDEARFVEMMNEQAAEWGCVNTHFANPMGWRDKDNYTTANDLLIIVKNIMEDETVREIATTRRHTIPATNLTEERKLKNYTMLMNRKTQGVLGGKSGSWAEDDVATSLLYDKDSLSAILILLKTTKKGRITDARKLLEFSHEVTPGFEIARGDDVEKIWVKHGEKTRLETVLKDTVYAYPASGKESDVRTEAKPEKLEAPIAKGEKVGELEVYANGELVATSDVVASEQIDEGWFPSYIYISNKASMIILACLLLIIIVILCYNHRVAKRNRPHGGRERYRYQGKH